MRYQEVSGGYHEVSWGVLGDLRQFTGVSEGLRSISGDFMSVSRESLPL